MVALASPELDIRGLTIVAGNNTIKNNTHSALRILEQFLLSQYQKLFMKYVINL